MEQRFYQGQIDPRALSDALLDEWDRDDTIAQVFDVDQQMIVQIGQREGGWFSDEPHQAITLSIEPTNEGLHVTMGQQQWFKENNIKIFAGGLIGFLPFFFAFPLGDFFRNDTVDQSLPDRIWQSIDRYTARSGGAVTGQTQRMATVACYACGVANPMHAERCSACGANLLAPPTCPSCSQQNPVGAHFCNRCGTQLV